jgi:putative oxidoreductase
MKKFFLFWLPNALLLFFMVGSGVYYFVDTPSVAQIFTDLGYPTYTLYFNAIAKFLGGIAIVVPSVPRFLKEWAYAGYLFIILLAVQAVWMTMPGIPWMMFVFIAIWVVAYVGWKKA